MSKTRKIYCARLVGRILLFAGCLVLWRWYPDSFAVLEGWDFFRQISPLHFLWVVWVADMVLQIVPIRNKVPLGSQKLFANRFKPIRDAIHYEALKRYIESTTKAASDLVCADPGHRCALQCRLLPQGSAVYDFGLFLRVRPDLRAGLVSLSSDYEKPLLHHLPDF